MHFTAPSTSLICSFNFSFPCSIGCQKLSPCQERDQSIKEGRQLLISKEYNSKHYQDKGFKKSIKRTLPDNQLNVSYGLWSSEQISRKKKQSRIFHPSHEKINSLKASKQNKSILNEKYSLKRSVQPESQSYYPLLNENQKQKLKRCKDSYGKYQKKRNFNITNEYMIKVSNCWSRNSIYEQKQSCKDQSQRLYTKSDSQTQTNGHFGSFNPTYQTPYIGKKQWSSASMKSSFDNFKNLRQTVKNPQTQNFNCKVNQNLLRQRNRNLQETKNKQHQNKKNNPLQLNLSSVRGKQNRQDRGSFHIQNIFDFNENSISNIQMHSPHQGQAYSEPISAGVTKNHSAKYINDGLPNSSIIFDNADYLHSSASNSINTLKKNDDDFRKQRDLQDNRNQKLISVYIQSSHDTSTNKVFAKNNRQSSVLYNFQGRPIETFVNKRVSSVFDSFEAENNEISLVVGRGFLQKSQDLISERSAQHMQSPQKKPMIIRFVQGIKRI